MIAKDLITRAPVTVVKDAPLGEAIRRMKEQDVGSVVVVEEEEGNVVGILTDRDIVTRSMGGDLVQGNAVRDIMTLMPVCLDGSADIDEALEAMEQYGVRRLPVLDTGGKLIGVISLDDILMCLSRVLGKAGTLIRAEVLGLV